MVVFSLQELLTPQIAAANQILTAKTFDLVELAKRDIPKPGHIRKVDAEIRTLDKLHNQKRSLEQLADSQLKKEKNVSFREGFETAAENLAFTKFSVPGTRFVPQKFDTGSIEEAKAQIRQLDLRYPPKGIGPGKSNVGPFFEGMRESKEMWAKHLNYTEPYTKKQLKKLSKYELFVNKGGNIGWQNTGVFVKEPRTINSYLKQYNLPPLPDQYVYTGKPPKKPELAEVTLQNTFFGLI